MLNTEDFRVNLYNILATD